MLLNVIMSVYHRYNYAVRVPLSPTLFRLLPTPLQQGKEIKVCAVLLTQGINEQQTMADAYVYQNCIFMSHDSS